MSSRRESAITFWANMEALNPNNINWITFIVTKFISIQCLAILLWIIGRQTLNIKHYVCENWVRFTWLDYCLVCRICEGNWALVQKKPFWGTCSDMVTLFITFCTRCPTGWSFSNAMTKAKAYCSYETVKWDLPYGICYNRSKLFQFNSKPYWFSML